MITVQSVWIGRSLPPLQQLSIRSFLAHGHVYHLYTYGEVDGVPAGATIRDAREILPGDRIFSYQQGFGRGSYSAFSNLFRYQLLFDRGGWWVDTDLVCLRPFAFESSLVFATEHEDDGTTHCATCALRCPAGAPLLAYCIDTVRSRDTQTLQWGEIGPQLFTTAVSHHRLTAHCAAVETFNPIDYIDFASLTAPDFDLSRLAGSHAVHFWNQMWKSRGLDPLADPPTTSACGALLARYPPPSTGRDVRLARA